MSALSMNTDRAMKPFKTGLEGLVNLAGGVSLLGMSGIMKTKEIFTGVKQGDTVESCRSLGIIMLKKGGKSVVVPTVGLVLVVVILSKQVFK